MKSTLPPLLPQVDLVASGVDTVADIVVNGVLVAHAENAHR
jgi:hypothetical protein